MPNVRNINPATPVTIAALAAEIKAYVQTFNGKPLTLITGGNFWNLGNAGFAAAAKLALGDASEFLTMTLFANTPDLKLTDEPHKHPA